MNVKPSILFLVVFISCLGCTQKKANKTKALPMPTGFVSDFEHIFTLDERIKLNKYVVAFEKETKIEIAIVTLDSTYTSSENFNNYTLALARNWGVGKKDLNNGMLIGISAQFRKVRIQNADGIQKLLSDSMTKEILDLFILPRFKEGNYFKGTMNGLEQFTTILRRK